MCEDCGGGVLTLQEGQKSRSKQQVRKRTEKNLWRIRYVLVSRFQIREYFAQNILRVPLATTATADCTDRERSKGCTAPLRQEFYAIL